MKGPGDVEARPRIVIISQSLPYTRVNHAGGVYVRELVSALEATADVFVLVPDTPAVRAAEVEPGTPRQYLVLGRRAERPAHQRPLFRMLATRDRWKLRSDASSGSSVLAASLLLSPSARRLLARADVVDLQWAETARLLPIVRRLASGARILVTFHDVRTQSFRRAARASTDPARRSALRRAERTERRVQSRIVSLATCITFSQKDAEELRGGGPTGASIQVVHPPIAPPVAVDRRPSGRPTVLFVALLARAANEQGLLWFLRRVWPRISESLPAAVLRVVGTGASPSLARAVSSAPGRVELVGFVDRLECEYAVADLCVIPLLTGAGVKFKTVEALVAGVPTVTTPVGAEGIGDARDFAGLTEDPEAFARACISALSDPAAAEARAATTREWAVQRYSRAAFHHTVSELYLGSRRGAATR